MNHKEFTSDVVKRALQKYHDTFTKSLKSQLDDVKDRVDIIEENTTNLPDLTTSEIDSIVRPQN